MPVPSEGALRKARILVVDDEADIRHALKDLLETTFEASVQVAKSGAEALDALEEEPADLVITDFRMPGMDGLAFLDAAQRVQPGVRHILVTAFDRELVRELGPRLPRERILQKPLAPASVTAEVKAMLA